jgi:2-polyprenyl-6-methoxyphenol hydroxylase-like FAD-dependent oxidoreductase
MKNETGTKRAMIIGGSLGGLFAANLLHRAGWDVLVFERVGAELSERGAGVVTHPELLAAIERIGIPLTDIGIEVRSRITLDKEGAVIGDYGHPQILTAWGRLYSVLKEAFPVERYVTGKNLTGLTQDADQVVATFADGSSASADVLIGADGIRSTVREQLAPAAKPQYAGYIAWRGLLEEGVLSAATHQQLFGHFAFCLPPREQILGYPVAGAGNALGFGKRRYNFVWYRPADADELRRLSTDDSGKVYENGIPPPLIARAVTEEIRAVARDILAPQFAEVVARTAQPFFQPIFDLESSTLAFGRVALLGDAAFVARPHCGMGVTKAAGDAIALAGLLESRDIPEALAAYSSERVDFGARIVTHARHLGAYMQAQLATAHEVAMAERYRTPQAVMSETAVPPQW